MNKPVILCVDDERVILTSLMDQLIHFLGEQYTIETAESGEEALEVLEDFIARGIEVPLIITDQIMPGMKGDQLLITIYKRYPQALKIFLTGQADANAVGNALNKADLYRYVAKPWDETDLKLTITEALASYQQDKLLTEQRRLTENALDQERLAKEALRQANAELEQRVTARTLELAQANAQLQEELAQRKLMEQALRQAKDAADAANLAKSAFLANMSHELRTPLNVILGFAQLMAHRGEVWPEFQENLQIIIRSGEHLLTLINQVLDLSKIEVGKMTLHETTVDLHHLLNGVVELFRLPAEQKGLRLLLDCGPDVPGFVNLDAVKLRQVLLNLLDNAVKFTRAGSVTLKIENCQHQELQEHQEDQYRDLGDLRGLGVKNRQSSIVKLRFSIADTGPGIAPEELPTLFQAFVQTKTGQSAQEGTGLGLSISRKFARLMGGDLTVQSAVAQGATFAFELPVSVAAPLQPSAPARPQHVVAVTPEQPRYRLLIVDDKWDSRSFLVKLLAPVGFELREARTGEEALDLWEQWRPHLILMDLRMSPMDGYEATQHIRQREIGNAPCDGVDPEPRRRTQDDRHGERASLNDERVSLSGVEGRTIIIATTASSFEEDRALALAAGCDDFLHKPLREADLFELLRKYLGVRYVYAASYASPETNADGQPAVTPAMLAALPDELRARLQQAVEAINLEQTNQLITQIRSRNAALAEALTGLMKHYRFDLLQKLFEEQP